MRDKKIRAKIIFGTIKNNSIRQIFRFVIEKYFFLGFIARIWWWYLASSACYFGFAAVQMSGKGKREGGSGRRWPPAAFDSHLNADEQQEKNYDQKNGEKSNWQYTIRFTHPCDERLEKKNNFCSKKIFSRTWKNKKE